MKLRQLTIFLAVAGMLLCTTSGALAQEESEKKTPVMGWQMMSQEERDQYRTAMRALQTEEERTAMRTKHRSEMRARAKAQGVELAEPQGPRGPCGRGDGARGQGRGRGCDGMTPEEKAKRREENRSKISPEQRERSDKEHHRRMRERARERGFELPDEPIAPEGAGQGQAPGEGQGPGSGETR